MGRIHHKIWTRAIRIVWAGLSTKYGQKWWLVASLKWWSGFKDQIRCYNSNIRIMTQPHDPNGSICFIWNASRISFKIWQYFTFLCSSWALTNYLAPADECKSFREQSQENWPQAAEQGVEAAKKVQHLWSALAVCEVLLVLWVVDIFFWIFRIMCSCKPGWIP